MDFYKKRTKEMYNKLKVTYPNNFARFKCIGGECEDTCCQGWDIEIDKDTFDEYSKVQDHKLKAMLSENIKCNVGELNIGDKIFIKDLVIPEGMRLDVDENAIVATIADNSAVDTDEDQSEDGTESKQ